MIEMGKLYRTRDGREVRIYAVDGSTEDPVHGAINRSNGWEVCTWSLAGEYRRDDKTPHDLIEIKPRAIDRIIEWLEKPLPKIGIPDDPFEAMQMLTRLTIEHAKTIRNEEDAGG